MKDQLPGDFEADSAAAASNQSRFTLK